MKTITLISSSLSPSSNSSILIDRTISKIDKSIYNINFVDLKKIDIPFCDGRSLDQYSENVQQLFEDIKRTDYLVFGFPIYCYSISGVFKNFIDIFSKAMFNKKYGVCCSLGSNRSYLAISDLQKILFFQSNAHMVNPTVVCDYSNFSDGKVTPDVESRIDLMLESLLSISKNS